MTNRFFEYQTATVWQSNNIRDNIGAYVKNYTEVATINISRVEPLQGINFELVDRGEIVTGGYKVYTLSPVNIGLYMIILNGFYRVINSNNWNNQYYELQLELLPGVNPYG